MGLSSVFLFHVGRLNGDFEIEDSVKQWQEYYLKYWMIC
jgi:hypothetical protein